MDSEGRPCSSRHSDQAGNSQAVVPPPPYWQHRRFESYSSVGHLRPAPICLEDNTDERPAETSPLWAKAVSINDHSLVSGNIPSVGDYIVWNCQIEMLDVSLQNHPLPAFLIWKDSVLIKDQRAVQW